MTQIVALLSWWEESPAWLTRCVSSIARFADHLIAVDGAYQHAPGAFTTPRSSGDQADVIAAAADAHGLGVTIHRPVAPWAGDEIEKRTFMFHAAALVAEPGRDWLFVIDADEVVTEAPGSLRDRLDALAAAGAEVATVDLAELPERGACPARRLFLADPTLRVEQAHYVYVAGPEHAPRFLWGDADVHELAPASHVGGFRIEHWSRLRAPERRQVALDYYERRDRYGLEQISRRRSPGEAPVWAFDPRPGSHTCAALVSPEEFSAIMERGYITLDGVRGRVVPEDCDEAAGFVRVYLDQPYAVPA